MTYKDKAKERKTTKERVARHRAKQKGVTIGCSACGDKGYIDMDKIGQYRKFCDCKVGKRLMEETKK